MVKNYFGTDGIRNKVGSGLMQPDKVLKLGWAIGMTFKDTNNNEILIGKDTRVSGYMLESALEAGLAAAGMNIALLGPMPTPAISYLTTTFRANAGIVISASHNPYYDNGIKIFDCDGSKISKELEEKISYFMEQNIHVTSPNTIGKARRINGAPDRYIEFCKSKLLPGLSLSGLKIVIDCANGSTYDVAEKVFKELGANVVTIANKPDGFNINASCGSTNISNVQAEVLNAKADFGISYDGDGDRALMVDKNAEIIDGDCILFILANHLKQKNKLNSNTVVGTVMSNQGLESSLKKKGISLLRTDVGDKYVMEKLHTLGLNLGGEPSGHIIELNKTISGDGIISSILVINAMLDQEQDLSELLRDYAVYPQKLISIRCENAKELMASDEIANITEEANNKLNGNGRILIRASGTEPVIRIMVESQKEEVSEELSKYLSMKIKHLTTIKT